SVRALIASGLAAAPQHDRVTVDEAVRLWQRLPAAAALATSNLLPRIPTDPARQPPEHAELLEELEHSCGTAAAELLAGRDDPHARVGRFGASAEHLARMPEAQFRAVWRAARVMPRALLDADSRSQAVLDLFKVRNSTALHGVRSQAATVLELTAEVCDRLPDDAYRTAARALPDSRRPDRRGAWRDLPALSVALTAARRTDAPDRPWGPLPAADYAAIGRAAAPGPSSPPPGGTASPTATPTGCSPPNSACGNCAPCSP